MKYFRTINQLELELANLPIFREADKIDGVVYRIALDMKFPNGEYLDVFLSQVEGCYTLSDKGGVVEYLAETGRSFPNMGDAKICAAMRSLYGVLTCSAEWMMVGTGKLGADLMRFAQAIEHFFDYEKARLETSRAGCADGVR